jgi:hypothetical protein
LRSSRASNATSAGIGFPAGLEADIFRPVRGASLCAVSFFTAASAQGREAAGQSPDCWKANYAGPGTARIWLCRYSATSGAFDGWQRIRADGQTVKFQEGKYLVLVQSDDTPNANLASLMHALQSALSKN